ncbi:HAMP domain-containing sensor histidine kinase [Paenibacillus piri]|uniref:histidine kinase n=1 Tax=Paenibacillus piri TaxID=2547395 RepID=A0A4R5KIC1_9BACL|nr:HAMP domain-containing sensor histidine kinase [Paenibacillus piri]TDF94508.1 HAMP domain-containing histidine kinase [Paenibacillus piri]
MMKNVPLALKIWLVMTAITLCLFTLLAFLLPWTLKGFFTEQIYDILLDSQRAVPSSGAIPFTSIAQVEPSATVERIQYITSTPKEGAKQDIPVQPNGTAGKQPGTKLPNQLNGGVNNVKPDIGGKSQAVSPEAAIKPGVDATSGAVGRSEAAGVIVEPGIKADSQDGILQKVFVRTEAMPFALTLKPANGPGVQHLIMQDGGMVSKTEPAVPGPFVEAIRQDTLHQKEDIQAYSREVDDRTVFYVIRKEQLEGKPGFMVSYAWGSYRNDLVMTMFQRLVLLMMVLIVVSWIPCLWLARYLSRPLVLMEQQAGRIAERDWHQPFVLNRKDEMGRLAQAFEAMRQRLVRQDKAQQFFLQNISHELKTPVMVIQSYAQSILDGIYPKGTIAGSVETIKSEATRLEKRIRDLLYLNKLNYMSVRERKRLPFDLSAVVRDCVERLRYRRPEIDWHVDLPTVEIGGDAEQWGVAIENLLDNQVRYANTRISITMIHGDDKATPGASAAAAGGAMPVTTELRIWNDGEPIDEALIDSMFDQFETGPDGQFGLGLAIVKQILTAHHARIRVGNEHGGVAFYIDPGPPSPSHSADEAKAS